MRSAAGKGKSKRGRKRERRLSPSPKRLPEVGQKTIRMHMQGIQEALRSGPEQHLRPVCHAGLLSSSGQKQTGTP